MTQKIESKRRQETMRFFNMLNEPERSEAIENYDENNSVIIPANIMEAVMYGFNWNKSKHGCFYWERIIILIDNKTYNFKIEPIKK